MENVISYEDFCKVDLRVGRIETAERVPKSKKLLKLSVNFGPKLGERQIVAGLGQEYAPEELINHNVVAVVNLAPRQIMGLDSFGMILATHDSPSVVKPCPAGMHYDLTKALHLAEVPNASPGDKLG